MNNIHMECSKCGGDMEAGQVMAPVRNLFDMILHPNLTEWYAGEGNSDKAQRKTFHYSLPLQKMWLLGKLRNMKYLHYCSK
ncbi:MAG: hypothetical protein QM730_29190 [Anaerolineales bacterium]